MSLPRKTAWIPTQQEIIRMRQSILDVQINPHSKSVDWHVSLKEVKDNAKGKTVGAQTFANGLDVVLADACDRGNMEVIHFFLQKHSHHFNVNESTPSYSRRRRASMQEYQYQPYSEMTDAERHFHQTHKTTYMHTAAQSMGEGFGRGVTAKDNTQVKVIKDLLRAGAKVDILDCCSTTPLMAAVRSGHIGVVRFLIEKGANVNHRDINGLTPLMHAARISACGKAMAETLLSAGADPSATDSFGYSALHMAVMSCNEEVIYTLVSNGVCPYQSNGIIPCPLFLIDHALFTDSLKNTSLPYLDFNRTISLLIQRTECPPDVKADALMLLASTAFLQQKFTYFGPEKSPEELFVQSLRIREAEHVQIPQATPIAVYGYRTEIQTVEEFERRCHLVEQREQELGFQFILARERILGYQEESVINLMLRVGLLQLEAGNVRSGTRLWLRATELMVPRSSQTPTHLIPKFCEMIGGSSSLLLRELDNILFSIPIKECRLFFRELSTHIITSLTTLSKRITGQHSHNGHIGTPAFEMQFYLRLLSGILESKASNIGANEIGKWLVQHCPKLIDQYGFQISILVIAVKDNNLSKDNKEKLILKLLEWGADKYLEEPDAHGHCAVFYSQEDNITTLLRDSDFHLM